MKFWGWGRIVYLCACLGLITAAAGCGGDDSQDASAQASDEHSIPEGPPEIDVPKGLPPKKLVIKDLWEGTGAVAQRGDEVKIHYHGVQWGAGQEHASSWRYSKVPVFKLGERRLLRGLTHALPGMKEGGGREVIIPHNLVYYPGGNHRPLGPLDALIYKVYLVDILNRASQ